MASYRIEFRSSVERDIRRLSRTVIPRILEGIQRLSENPWPCQSVKLEDFEGKYRLRVGVYRVIYNVDTTSNTVVVHYIRHRREAYRRR